MDEDITGLRKQLFSSYPGDRENAARRLADFGFLSLSALPDLETRLKDPSNGVRDAARIAIAAIKHGATGGEGNERLRN